MQSTNPWLVWDRHAQSSRWQSQHERLLQPQSHYFDRSRPLRNSGFHHYHFTISNTNLFHHLDEITCNYIVHIIAVRHNTCQFPIRVSASLKTGNKSVKIDSTWIENCVKSTWLTLTDDFSMILPCFVCDPSPSSNYQCDSAGRLFKIFSVLIIML